VTFLLQKSATSSRNWVATSHLQTQSLLCRRSTTKFVIFFIISIS